MATLSTNDSIIDSCPHEWQDTLSYRLDDDGAWVGVTRPTATPRARVELSRRLIVGSQTTHTPPASPAGSARSTDAPTGS